MRIFVFTPTLLLISLFSTSLFAQGRESKLINDNWKFTKSNGAVAETLKHNDSWSTVQIPHDWSVREPLNPSLASAAGYLPGGTGWYQKKLFIPIDSKDKKLSVYFEGVSSNSEVFFNGQSLGKRPYGFSSFSYDITPYTSYGDSNTIVVKVDRTDYNNARWYVGSGIVRNVFLVSTNPIFLQQWGTNYYTHTVDTKGADVTIGSTIQNTTNQNTSVTLLQEIFDKKTNILLAKKTQNAQLKANEQKVLSFRMKVPGAKSWSHESPTLYTLKTSIVVNKKIVDEELTTIGFRTLGFDADKGFALNGNWIKLKGVCLHHDAGVLGAAVPKEVWERRLKVLKSLGVNAIRTSHNPQNPELYALCDELGLLVMDEAFDEWKHPKKKWIEGWNVGMPGFDGYAPHFDDWGDRDLADMVLRDRRHPSIIMWSIGNEVDYPNDPYSHSVLDSATIGQQVFGKYLPDNPDAMELGLIARRLAQIVKQHDTTRPTTAALAGVVMSNFTGYPEAVDITGYNYTENRYEQDHKAYPKRVIYGSENRHDMNAWKAVRDKDFIFGQFLWTGIDYLGESGRWPSRGMHSGLVNLAGFVKPRGAFRKALWSNVPEMYVGSYINWRPQAPPSIDAWPVWNYEQGQQIRVVAYTNAAKAQLILNGNTIGDKKPYDDRTGIIYWDIPFERGTLIVNGYDENDAKISTDTIKTSDAPENIKLSAYTTTISKNEVAQIEVTLTDKEDVLAVLADNMITCKISGPGVLLGMEAGDNTDMGIYTDASQRVFKGKLIAYIQATDLGNIQIQFSSPWLKTTDITITVK